MSDLYHIPNDDGKEYRIKKFVEYQHEVPSIHYRFLGNWIKKYRYDPERTIKMCWLMSVTYNEITCVLIDEIGIPPERLWELYGERLDFGSSRKYAKNMGWFVPLMNSFSVETRGFPYEWLLSKRQISPFETYKNIQRALLSMDYVGRFSADLFLESVAYLKDYIGIQVEEPLKIDWKNCSNLTSGIFNIFYEDERAEKYEKTRCLSRRDYDDLSTYLSIIQQEIKRSYPGQDNSIAMFIGKICSFRNLFKGTRYGGFHHDRELGVIKKYEKDFKEYQYLLKKCYELRAEIFPKRFLGEFCGWSGIRKERKKLWLRTGFTGAEQGI